MQEISGGTSADMLTSDIHAAMADPSVEALMLLIDSPGGTVAGTQKAANAIAALRGVKPIGAYAEDIMASAAYWIGSAADPGSIWIASDTTQVGSIGVVATHTDMSQREAALGMKTTEIVAGKYKRIASEHGPLTESGQASIQAQVDHIYAAFVADVARNRGVSVDRVLSDMADGRVFLGRNAIDAGLVDGMTSLADAAQQLKSRAAAARKPIPMKGQTRRASMSTPQEIAAAFAAESPEAAEVLRAQGSASERDRAAAVRKHAMPGYEALIEQLAADGVTTGPEAAERVLGAMKADTQRTADARRADAIAPVRQTDSDEDVSADAAAQGTTRLGPDGRLIDMKSAAVDRKAKAYQAKHPGTDYIAAVKAVINQGA
jgi:signal peptide peptidase SppA